MKPTEPLLQPAGKAAWAGPQQQSTSGSVFSFDPAAFTVDCSEADFLPGDAIA